MSKIIQTAPPAGSLIAPFAEKEAHYVDAFRQDTGEDVRLSDYIAAFYTTPLFRAERAVLRLTARAPSSDADATALAAGVSDTFAIWTVEARRDDEILLADRSGRTKSWLHVAPGQVWFGSVVVPVARGGTLTLGPVFHALLGFHQIYSRLLLRSAVARVT